MQYGYTTGACAQAAANAAAKMLLSGHPVNKIEISLPCGDPLMVAVDDQSITETEAVCSVTKDSGDDPDVTNGIKIFAAVRKTSLPGITVLGGKGVGRVTKPGLPVPVGGPAINPVPREMLERDLSLLAGEDFGLEVTISVPEGEEKAKKTWNPRLGIEGGISIIGTTGRVIPRSQAAYQKSIETALDVAVQTPRFVTGKTVYITPGYIGEKYFKKELSLTEDEIIKFGDHAGFTFQKSAEKGALEIVIAGHIGKLVKIAAGLFNTHYSYGDARLETIAALAASAGASTQLVNEILDLTLSEASIDLLKLHGLADKTFNLVAERCRKRCSEYLGGKAVCSIIVLDLKGNVLGESARMGGED